MTRSSSLLMDIIEVEENLFAVSDAKLHGRMCKILSAMYCKVMSIFPSLEAAKPRSKSGIQALCSLHVAMEKTKNILQHCSECSKLYLAITGESVLLKSEEARFCLTVSLKRVEDIVPQSVGLQIQEIICELESIEFSLDPLEKQVGNDLIILLQQERRLSDSIDNNELESFHQAALRLAITSSRTALIERRALKKLMEKARTEEDKRKESIVAYLLHLMRKYSKLFQNEFSDENDSPGSTPCSPEEISPGCINQAFERQLLKHSSINFKPGNKKSVQMTIPPEELRCPISLHLMYDPVIIASGQTYERSCIEKWFSDGHSSCPKTQQKLSHLSLTPNYCVKNLIASWCEQNGVPLPDAPPPESLDINYWRLELSECESVSSRSIDILGSCKLKGVKVVPLEESCIIAETGGNKLDCLSAEEKESDLNIFDKFEFFLTVLNEGEDLKKKCNVVEQIRFLLKNDEEARMVMGAKGFVQALLKFLQLAVKEGNSKAQESGAMALFNLAVNNCRNKEIMLKAGVISLLEQMILNSDSHEYATALYLNLSCLEDAKRIIGLSCAVPFLCHLLQTNVKPLCKLDAIHALYNLSTLPSNTSNLLSAGVITALQSLLADPADHGWTEKAIAVLIHLALTRSGKDEIRSASGLISALARILDSGEAVEQEQSVACLLILCDGNERCSQMVLQEGVIPGLVSMSVNGTARGKEKAQKLLMLFREQRQQEQPPTEWGESGENFISSSQTKPLCKSMSRRRVGKALSFLWKSKSHSSYQW